MHVLNTYIEPARTAAYNIHMYVYVYIYIYTYIAGPPVTVDPEGSPCKPLPEKRPQTLQTKQLI